MKQVFEALEKDSRLTPEKISAMTGIAVDDVKSTIENAEKG